VPFQFLPKSMTLNGLPHTTAQAIGLSEPTVEIWKNIHHYHQWQEYITVTFPSDGTKFMRIFVGVSWWAVTWLAVTIICFSYWNIFLVVYAIHTMN